MKKAMSIGGALAALAVCLSVAPLQSSAHPSSDARKYAAPVSCAIKATPTRVGVRLTAVASSALPIDGDYDLRVRQKSAGGQSDIRQGGPVDFEPRGQRVLGSVEIGGADPHYLARLRIDGDRGPLCEAVARR